MDKFLTNFAKSVAIAPSPPRRRSSVMQATNIAAIPENLGDKEFSEIRGHLQRSEEDQKEKVVKREM